MKICLTFILICIFSVSSFAQFAHTPWVVTGAPVTPDRYDDIYFLNKDTGWAVTPGAGGKILRTYDGGNKWDTLVSGTNMYYRDVVFLDAETGFVGLLSPISNTYNYLLKTTDGGWTWAPVTNMLAQTTGICGMHKINDSTIVAVGRFPGPAFIYKSTNRGNSWTFQDLSPLANGLIDVYFVSPDTGFVTGTLTSYANGTFQAIPPDSCGVILYTNDGGINWSTVALTSRKKELVWKICFSSRKVGYASIESTYSNSDVSPQYFLKTTDGGLSWKEKYYCNDGRFEAQAIGFINDSVGWIGGRNFGNGANLTYTYQTVDGGESWIACQDMMNLNRFRRINDTMAYFAGKYIYKLKYASCSAPMQSIGITTCNTLPYTVGNLTITQPGIYYPIVQGTSGCNRKIMVQATKKYVRTPQNVYACNGFYAYKGKTYSTGQTFYDTIATVSVQPGVCDSIIQFHVLTPPVNASVIYDTICNGSTYNIDGNQLTATGVYTLTICTSTIQVALHVLPVLQTTIDTTISPGQYIILPSGNTASIAGVYTDTLQAETGCDSIVRINLSVWNGLTNTLWEETPVRVYPNPATNQLYVEWEDEAEIVNEAKLLNLKGQEIPLEIEHSKKFITLSWSKNTLKGVYMLKLKSTEGKEITRKVVIL